MYRSKDSFINKKKQQYDCFTVVSVCAPAQSYPTLCDPLDCMVHQALLSIGFPRQEPWGMLPFPSLIVA